MYGNNGWLIAIHIFEWKIVGGKTIPRIVLNRPDKFSINLSIAITSQPNVFLWDNQSINWFSNFLLTVIEPPTASRFHSSQSFHSDVLASFETSLKVAVVCRFHSKDMVTNLGPLIFWQRKQFHCVIIETKYPPLNTHLAECNVDTRIISGITEIFIVWTIA